MEKKDLAKEYADLQYKLQQDTPEEAPNLSKGIFGHEDIVNAFNAGCDSVVKNMPKLKWENIFEDGLCIALFSFGVFSFSVSYRIEFAYKKFNLFYNNVYINCYISLLEAKQAANEDYKKRIKQILGL